MKITLNNVCKSIQGAQILKDISLEFESAHIYGLYGANGSGKTMLMRAVAGLMKIDGGHVIIDGSEIGKDQDFPDSIGFIIENPSFLNTYTGFDNLKLIAELKRIADDKAICDALERVGLDPKDKRKFKKYSLGMKQRLGIAAAIMEKPELIVLDEPTSYLDIRYKLELLTILKRMVREEDLAVLMSLHELDLARRVSDTVVCVAGDHIDRVGPPEEIFTRDYIAKLYHMEPGRYDPCFSTLDLVP